MYKYAVINDMKGVCSFLKEIKEYGFFPAQEAVIELDPNKTTVWNYPKDSTLIVVGKQRFYDFIWHDSYDIDEYDESYYKYHSFKYFFKGPYLKGWSLRKERKDVEYHIYKVKMHFICDNGEAFYWK